ncbi:hypothetical protein ACQW02_18740 [Humitalea sp. 24SJ18S-53]|uniref:hypothetical protein n=1 Tax=Humitalea sp. 24SJ18S-53 TaxID=3422307 RepID=UPI003D66864B
MRRRLLAAGLALAAGPALAQPRPRGDRRPDPATVAEVRGLVAQADALLAGADARRQVARASELLEQAETRILTRSTLAATADQPVEQGAAADIAAARHALIRGDIPAARRAIAVAQGRSPGARQRRS